jgi:ABC-type nitrate/sulfonate/bicarbonate transport system permease component
MFLPPDREAGTVAGTIVAARLGGASFPSRTLTVQVATLLALWAIWEAVAASGLLYKGVIPSSVAILGALARMLATGPFWTDCAVTVGEVVVATAIGGAAGIAVGVVVGGSRFLAATFEPYLNSLAATPKVVVLPVLMVLFGVGPASKVALGALSCFFPMAISVAVGVQRIDPVLLLLSRSLRLTRLQRVRAVTLPSLRAPILVGLRLALGMATVGCLVSELKFANSGLGFEAMQDYDHFQVPAMYAIILVIFALVAGGNALIARAAPRRGMR